MISMKIFWASVSSGPGRLSRPADPKRFRATDSFNDRQYFQSGSVGLNKLPLYILSRTFFGLLPVSFFLCKETFAGFFFFILSTGSCR